jgi:hypothetical protein
MSNNPLDVVTLLRRGLELEVQRAVTEAIVAAEMTKFESSLRARIKPIIESVSLNRIEHVKQLMYFRDELHVVFHHKGDNPSE